MLGTFVSLVSVSIMAMQTFTWTSAAVAGLLQALVPALLMNVAIVGVNQLYDVEIDKVNKPYLPLASGELSMQQGARLSLTVALSNALQRYVAPALGPPPPLASFGRSNYSAKCSCFVLCVCSSVSCG
jgi:homogentisate phytyltransferase/homogentisate geranylgeranyltransferase